MGKDLFKDVPTEIVLNILSRLPARTTMSCKCVCKPWLHLLTTPQFVKSHLSKSVPGLAIFQWESRSKPYKIVEFVDELDEELDLDCDERCWSTVFNFDLPFRESMHSSVNGLLFMGALGYGDLFICNPITREYIMIPSPRQRYSERIILVETYGFGASRVSGQCKVVRIFIEGPMVRRPRDFECQVYTVGSGSWRRVACDSQLMFDGCPSGAFLHGNLHWLPYEGTSRQVSCLDLETELFSTFSPPPLDDRFPFKSLSVLGDCLCICENSKYEIDIWLMKEYGDERSWTKEFSIRNVDMKDIVWCWCIRPIKVFKNGDILMELASKLLYYSSKTKTVRVDKAYEMEGLNFGRTTIYTPSFLPLRTTFAMENVSSF